MKVNCTKCRATFEVDESKVPPTGKLVRCSECNHAFIWRPPGPDSALGAPGSRFDFGGADRLTPESDETGGRPGIAPPPAGALPNLDEELSLPPAPKRPTGMRPAPPPPPRKEAAADVADLPTPRKGPPPPPRPSSTISDMPMPGAPPRPPPPKRLSHADPDEITPAGAQPKGVAPLGSDAGWSIEDDSNLPAPAGPVRRQPPRSVPEVPTPVGARPRTVSRPPPPPPGSRQPPATPELPTPVAELPTPVAELPTPAAELPTPAAWLPTPAAEVPTPAAELPTPAAWLPTPAAELPTPAAWLPTPAAELPTPAAWLPTPAAPAPSFHPPPPAFPPPPRPPGAPSASPLASTMFQDLPPTAGPSAHESGGFAPAPPPPPGVPSLPDLPPLDALPDLDAHFGDFPPPPTGGTFPEPGAAPADGVGVDAAYGAGAEAIAEPAPGEEGAPGAAVAGAAVAPRPRPRRKGKLRIGRVLALAGIVLALLGLGTAVLASYTNVFGGRDKNRAAFEEARRGLAEDSLIAFGRVINQMEPLIERDPKDREARALEAQAHFGLAFAGRASENQMGQARAAELGTSTPDDTPDVVKARALAALGAGQTPDAVRWLKALTTARPNDALAWTYLGWTYLRDGNPAEAQKAFQVPLKGGTPPVGARYGLARALETMGKRAEALAEYQKLTRPPPGRFAAAVAVERLSPDKDPNDAEKRVVELTAKAGPSTAQIELAEAWTWLGQRSQSAGRNGEAEDRYKKALGLDPSNLAAKIGLARLICESDRVSPAIPILDEVLKRQPKNLEALYTMIQAQILNQHAEAAEPFLKTVAALAPKDARTHYWQGRLDEVKGGTGATERAAKHYEDSIAADAKFIDGYVMLSNLYRTADPEKARATLAKAEEQAADDPPLHNKLGEVYLALGDSAKAESYFRKVIEKAPAYHKARMNLAAALEISGKFDESDAALADLEQLHKGYPGLSERRASLAVKRQHWEEAAQLYDQALAESQPRAALLIAAGNVNFKLGALDKAKKQFSDAAVDDPRSGPAHLGLARVALSRGHAEEASYEAKRSLNQVDTGEAHIAGGQASEQLGRGDLAREDYSLATKFPATEFDGRMGLARLEAHSGAVQDALAELDRIIKLNHTRAEPYVLQGDCYEELSKPDEARKAYETATKLDIKNGEAAFKYGRNLKDAGKRGIAADLLERASKLGGDQKYVAEALLLAGDARRAGKQDTEALNDYKRFLALAPKNAPERPDIEREVRRLEEQAVSLSGRLAALRRAIDYATTSARVVRRIHLLDGMTPSIGFELARRAIQGGAKGPFSALRLHALTHPDLPAIVDGEVRLSYGELGGRIGRLADGLHRLGVGPADRVALLLHNGHEIIEASAGLAELGATAVPVGYRLKPKEVAYVLENSGAKALLFHSRHAATVEAALLEPGTPGRAACFAAPGPVPEDGGPRPPAPGFPSYEALLASGDPAGPPRGAGGKAGGFMIYTSGTTGRAKGAHRDFAESGLEPVAHFVAALPIAPGERHLVVCPLYHSAATAFTAITFFAGGCVVILDHFEPRAILRTMERERITSAMMVPTMLNRLCSLGVPEIRRCDLQALRWLVSGAAPLPTELARRVEEAFGPVLFNFYGATETGFVTIARPGEHTARPGTIGRAVGGVDIRLLDEAGQPVRDGEVGELYAQSAMLVGGYHKNEAATRSAVRDGYFSVGDLARRDADGYYYLADRKHDMVISGGVNIYPFEIEQRLHAHPAVSDAAVVGCPDPDWGETLAAFVVLRDGMAVSAEELQRFVADELADFKRPRRVIFVDALPRNPTGKVLKRELRARLAPPEPAPASTP